MVVHVKHSNSAAVRMASPFLRVLITMAATALKPNSSAARMGSQLPKVPISRVALANTANMAVVQMDNPMQLARNLRDARIFLRFLKRPAVCPKIKETAPTTWSSISSTMNTVHAPDFGTAVAEATTIALTTNPHVVQPVQNQKAKQPVHCRRCTDRVRDTIRLTTTTVNPTHAHNSSTVDVLATIIALRPQRNVSRCARSTDRLVSNIVWNNF